MEVKMFLGLAVGILAISAASAFRDNDLQQKWSPYKPRWFFCSYHKWPPPRFSMSLQISHTCKNKFCCRKYFPPSPSHCLKLNYHSIFVGLGFGQKITLEALPWSAPNDIIRIYIDIRIYALQQFTCNITMIMMVVFFIFCLTLPIG